MDNINAIETAFKSGDLPYIDAILRLQNLGWQAIRAEEQVGQWEIDIAEERARTKIQSHQ